MNKQKFFHFGQKLTLTTVVLGNELGIPENQLENLIESNNIDLPVVFIQQKEGHRWADVLDRRTLSKFFIISDRFADLIKENKLTGCKFVPIKIVGLKGQYVNGYTGLYITGQSGILSYANSKIVERETPAGNGKMAKYYKGQEIIDWGGNDFFLPSNNLGVIVTEKVKTVIERYRLSNVRFEDLDEIEVWDYIVEFKKNNLLV